MVPHREHIALQLQTQPVNYLYESYGPSVT
jgi:hypothetical protein